ncbi:cation:proton antiporter [Ktedonospora formicarum]|uniref:Cation/H+ exchanger transmembrane domain-containing protein n=1 Tax=Ktedonospora formicarum TaxID=2778364 RepID=A0A8J3I4S6_9CHLR|nr:cation:proton antiporter [Ktedonospora formicarum]GHO46162.1 hypothetical protein KSX_43250 [Ktedonospora formicarum]
MVSEFSSEAFIAVLALVGIVIIIAALISGVIERSGIPQVAVFLLIGAMLGPAGMGLLHITLDSSILRIVATLSLALVLFTDAISLDLQAVRRSGTLALLVLGPGTLLSAGFIALLAWWILRVPPPAAILLGAALASTDPVLLRGLLRRDDIPAPVHQVLRLESGLNDAVLLPIVLVAMEFLSKGGGLSAGDWGRLALDLCVLGPGAGMIVGVCGVSAMALIRQRFGIRRDYESLFSLGIAFTAYAAAEAVHGSGFLAAFVAGLTISVLDVELCDCFLEYGETTSELMLLFTFVLFGSSLIWSGITILSWPLLLFAICSLLVRPVAFLLSLIRTRLNWQERRLIAWFGPRGLSSLLLILLPVFSGVAGSDYLFTVCTVVVLFSVIAHGGTPLVLKGRDARRRSRDTVIEDLSPEVSSEEIVYDEAPEEEKEVTPLQVPKASHIEKEKTRVPVEQQPAPLRITLADTQSLIHSGAQVLLLDVRKARDYYRDEAQARGSIRLDPDNVEYQARKLNLPRSAWLIAYCA